MGTQVLSSSVGSLNESRNLKLLEHCHRHGVYNEDDDVLSTMSESSSGIGGTDTLSDCKTYDREVSGRKVHHGHESDVDSGIVSGPLMDNHTESISSSETDSNQGSTSNERKPKPEPHDATQWVHFDEQLQLSEENIRRSCRKLFANLYSHRFSYPCYSDKNMLNETCRKQCEPSQRETTQSNGPGVLYKEKLVPNSRFGVAKVNGFAPEPEPQNPKHTRIRSSVSSTSNTVSVKNVQEPKPTSWHSETNISHCGPKFLCDINYGDSGKIGLHKPWCKANGVQKTDRICDTYSPKMEMTKLRRLSIESSNSVQSHRQTPVVPQYGHSNRPSMHKSLSCTVLSQNFSTTSERPDIRRTSDPISISSLNIPDLNAVPGLDQTLNNFRHQEKIDPRRSDPRRTSDPINIPDINPAGLDRTCKNFPQATRQNSMIRAYARVVPILSEDLYKRRSSNRVAGSTSVYNTPYSGHFNRDLDCLYPPTTVSEQSNESNSNIQRDFANSRVEGPQCGLRSRNGGASPNVSNEIHSEYFKHLYPPTTISEQLKVENANSQRDLANSRVEGRQRSFRYQNGSASSIIVSNEVHSEHSKRLYPPTTISGQSKLANSDTPRDLVHSRVLDGPHRSFRYNRGSESANSGNGTSGYPPPGFRGVSNSLYVPRKAPVNEVNRISSCANVSNYKSLTLGHKVNETVSSSRLGYDTLDESKKNRFTSSLPALDSLKPPDNGNKTTPTRTPRSLYQSDYVLYRHHPPPSTSSGKSILNRLQGFGRSAKNAVQKAFSMERIYRPEREERHETEGQKLKRSRSFIRGLKDRMSKKKKREKKRKSPQDKDPQSSNQESLNTSWDESKLGIEAVEYVEGQLLQLNLDGSQVIELAKPAGKPYGFFVARGRIKNSRGVFVSRMRDQETEERLTGLLGIGDEILEIDGLNVKHADILQVNSMMAQRNCLVLTVLPYVCRKD